MRFSGMSDEKLHVIPLGEHWEVETENGTPLLHEEKKSEAVSAARDLARDQGVEEILVHDEDGVTENISVSPEK